MTIKEFDNQEWTGGMTMTHNKSGQTFHIASPHFTEKIIGGIDIHEESLWCEGDDDLEVYWFRCENITINEN